MARLTVDLQRNDASFHSSHGFGRLFLLSVSTVSPIDRRRAGARAARHAFLQPDAHGVLVLARFPREVRAEEAVLYVTALLSELHQYNMSCQPPYPQANYSKCREREGEKNDV